jgi:hypothetical protein
MLERAVEDMAAARAETLGAGFALGGCLPRM